MWYRCLYATTGTDLRKILRANASRGAAQVPGSHGEYGERKASLGKNNAPSLQTRQKFRSRTPEVILSIFTPRIATTWTHNSPA